MENIYENSIFGSNGGEDVRYSNGEYHRGILEMQAELKALLENHLAKQESERCLLPANAAGFPGNPEGTM